MTNPSDKIWSNDFEATTWSPGDTTLDNPNYHELVDNVQKQHPDEDFRTAGEIQEDEDLTERFQEGSVSEFPTDEGLGSEEVSVDQATVEPFEEGKSPYDQDSVVPTTLGFGGAEQESKFSEKEERFIKSHLPVTELQKSLWDPKNYSGEHNLTQTLWQVNQIRNSPELTAVFDRDGDGEYTIVDRYDLSRMNWSPQEIAAINANWLKGLENKDFGWRLKGLQIQQGSEGPLGLFPQLPGQMPGILVPFWVTDGNMSRYIHRRRVHALAAEGEGDVGMGIRQNILGPSLEMAKNTLTTVDRLYSVATGGDFIGAQTPIADFVFNDKDPMSANSMYMDPVQRSWGDSVVSEVTYYGLGAALTYLTLGKAAPLMLTRGATMIGTGSKIGTVMNATAGGMKYAFAGGLLPKGGHMTATGLTGLFQKGVSTSIQGGRTFAAGFLETFPAAFFRDTVESGYDTINEDTQFGERLLTFYPKSAIFGRQWHAGLASPLGKQFSYSFGVSSVDGGFSMALMGAFKGIRGGITRARFAKPNAAQLKTSTSMFDSTHYTQPINDGKHFHDLGVEKAKDIQEAAEHQLNLFDEGPGNIYYDPDNTAAQDFSTYGPHKNGQDMPAQGTVADRTDIRQSINDLDEIDGQVTVEGGSTGQLIGPVQLREYTRFGIPDNFRGSLVDSLINDPVYKAQINALPKDKRTLGNLHEGTLKRLQELEGRDAAALTPEEYWGSLILDQPLGVKVDGNEIGTWTVENLQIADALNRTLLMRVRDLAAGTTELLGKTDIFAQHGAMKNIADNLVLGLSEAKRTRYTWGLMRDVLNSKGGKLTADDVAHIKTQTTRRADQIHGETQEQIRLLMRMLKNNDSQELAEGMLEAFQMSNKIHNWKDFDAFVRSKVKGGEFDGKVHTGSMIRELQGVMVNSILSGPKTPLRAILGTTTNAYYNSLNEAAGALIRAPFTDDLVQRRVALAKAKSMIELIPEAWDIFRKSLDTKFSGDFANIRTRYQEAPSQGDLDWELVTNWTERNGTDGDKAALYLSDMGRKMNNQKLLGWSPRTMAAVDDTFRWLLARARSKEMGLRKVLDELGDSSAEISPAMLKKAEDAHFNSMKDIDGNIDLKRDAWLKKQFEEITLTSELKGFAGALDKVFNAFPLMKPFYLFARTGINGLNLTLKNTPGIALLHKETIDILSHSGDDFAELARYGITNANDLANAKALITGRQAVGSAVVSMMGMKYMSGQLSGNGPADKQLKQNWINAGWKPNHMYFGNVGFNYSSIEPFNVIFSSIADIGDNMELMGSEWAEKRFQAVAFVLGRGLTSKTYMSGLDNMMQLIQMKPWAWNKSAANVLNNSIPLAGMRNEFGKFVNPHMKELNSDIWSGIRNRNQGTEFLASKPLVEKSDMLNGKPINNWNFIGRAFNAVSPIQIDYKSSSPGRQLLLDSNYDLKSTTYSYKGYSFVENATVRSHFQNAIGNAQITYKGRTFKNLEKALDFVSTQKDIKISMAQMNANKNNPSNWDINPTTYPHNTVINNLIQQARSKAWVIINDPKHPGYTELLQVKSEKDGQTSRTRDNRQEILDLSFPDKKINLFQK
mgnify:CR=1 FL=1